MADQRDDGGPAFPINDMQRVHDVAMAASISIPDPQERERAYILARGDAVGGMTLRDYFAAAALPAIAAQPSFLLRYDPDQVADRAYEWADAMLKARRS